MKINNVELSKKDFWIPFVIVFFVYFFGKSYVSYLSIKTIVENFPPYTYFFLISLFTLPFGIVLVFIPTYFTIKRLLSGKPLKVFYLELPIFVIVYSIISNASTLFSLMVGGPDGLTVSDIEKLMIFATLFIIIWLFLLVSFLYCYYKKRFRANLGTAISLQ